jgi:DDE domain
VARFARHRVGDRWHVDETYVKVAGRWIYLYRAVDRFGQVIDVYASARRDSEAARRFFQLAGTSTGVVPSEVITDRATTYPGVLDQLWPAAWYHTEKFAKWQFRSKLTSVATRSRFGSPAGVRAVENDSCFPRRKPCDLAALSASVWLIRLCHQGPVEGLAIGRFVIDGGFLGWWCGAYGQQRAVCRPGRGVGPASIGAR